MVNDRSLSGRHLVIGKRGEEAAARHLRWRGYRILGRNVKTAGGEIDIVAKRGRTVVFVEVKARSRHDEFEPSDRVNWAKVRRLRRAAGLWMEERGEDIPARIDVIGVRNGKVVEHHRNVTGWGT